MISVRNADGFIVNMSENREAKTFAILIHQLPGYRQEETLKKFRHIEKVSHDDAGLQIYFSKYSCVRESILKQKIIVGGTSYRIYPLVTDLTICGIKDYVSEHRIERWMSKYGTVVKQYLVKEVTARDRCETTSTTNDRRVILDVPEVFADFSLSTVSLPKLGNFRVMFFCRLCRQNGHKQYQCRSLPSENHWRRRYSESGTSERFQTSPVKERQYVQHPMNHESVANVATEELSYRDRHCIRRECELVGEVTGWSADGTRSTPSQTWVNWDNLNATPEHYGSRMEAPFHRQCSAPQTATGMYEYSEEQHAYEISDDACKINENPSSSKRECVKEISRSLPQDFVVDKQRKARDSDSLEIKGRKGIFKNTASPEETTRNQCPKTERKTLEPILSSLFPPDADPETSRELIKTLVRTNPRDVSPDVEKQLKDLLSWNTSGRVVGKKASRCLKWLKLYASKVDSKREAREGFYKKAQHFGSNSPKRNAAGGNKATGTPQEPARRRKMTLSEGIDEVISVTEGVLNPSLLRNFLNQVRCRKKQAQFATAHFTEDLPGLAAQLQRVVSTYYQQGKRGSAEDQDISFIKRLRLKLLGNPDVPVNGGDVGNCLARHSSGNTIPQSTLCTIQPAASLGSWDDQDVKSVNRISSVKVKTEVEDTD